MARTLKLNKTARKALGLLEERFKKDQQEILADYLVEHREDPRGAWELKEKDGEIVLVRRGAESGDKERDPRHPPEELRAVNDD